MHRRSDKQLRPAVDRLESKQLMTTGASQAHTMKLQDGSATAAIQASGPSGHSFLRLPHHQPEPVQRLFETSLQPGIGPVTPTGARAGVQHSVHHHEERDGAARRQQQFSRKAPRGKVLSDSYGLTAVAARAGFRLLRSDQEVLSAATASWGLPGRPRRLVLDTHPGTLGNLSENQV